MERLGGVKYDRLATRIFDQLYRQPLSGAKKVGLRIQLYPQLGVYNGG